MMIGPTTGGKTAILIMLVKTMEYETGTAAQPASKSNLGETMKMHRYIDEGTCRKCKLMLQ